MFQRRRVPVLGQFGATDCGASCLAMILSYHGRATSVSECRDYCAPGRDGLTALTIARAARQYGLQVKAFTLEPEKIKYLTLPIVVHWEFNHFIVVESWSPKKVEIVDPAVGRRSLTFQEFDEGFTGVALVFEPGLYFKRRERALKLSWLKHVQSIFWTPGARGAMAQVVAVSLLLQLAGLALPVLTKITVDRIIPFQISSVMPMLGISMALMVAAHAVISYLRGALLIYLRGSLDTKLMHNFFEHLLSLPFSFYQKQTSGDLLMRLGSNSLIRETLTNQVLSVILDGPFVLLYLVILLGLSPAFGALAAALAGLQILMVLATSRRLKRLMQRELAAKSEEQGYLVEAIVGISMLKAAGAEGRAFERWSNLFTNQLNVSLERSKVSVMNETVISALRMMTPLLLLWLGAMRVLDGSMSLGMMLALITLVSTFLAPIMTLIANGQQLQLVRAHLDRIADVLEAEPEQTLELKPSINLLGNLELRCVSFRYDPNVPLALSQISCTIEAGQKVALVGPTGSGKSTCALLMVGLYQPTEGAILYEGVPLNRLDYQAFRAQLGVVLQEPRLFSGSIRQNISLMNPTISFERVVEVAKLAGIHEDICQMPMGYETYVSEGGMTLSGGQRQRLAIARALSHSPSILLLDEATSHLDAQKEEEIEMNLNNLPCTRIVIAHRLSTVRNADQILFLDQGRIVERGTHEELTKKGGLYAALLRRQTDASTLGVSTIHGGEPELEPKAVM